MSESFLQSLTQPEPNPGGGCAAAYASRVALALIEKITRVELSRPSLSFERNLLWQDLLHDVKSLSDKLNRLQEEDGAAYVRMADSKGSGPNSQAFQAALHDAIQCPMQIMETIREALHCAAKVGQNCKRHLYSDVLLACEILCGAGRGAYHIAFVNVERVESEPRKTEYSENLKFIRGRLMKLCNETMRAPLVNRS